MTERLAPLRTALLRSCRGLYGARLVSLAIFGSWARGTATPPSDLDVLVVADPLPPGRRKRVAEFEAVERDTTAARRAIWAEYGTETSLSPVIRTPEEVRAGSPLFLDMTDWCDILQDNGGLLSGYLNGLRARLRQLGARRLARKGGYCWQYKPGATRPEVVTL